MRKIYLHKRFDSFNDLTKKLYFLRSNEIYFIQYSY